MDTITKRMRVATIGLIILSLFDCNGKPAPGHNPHPNGQAAFDYIKKLEGQWVVQGGKEGVFGWEFVVTSRGSVIVERLKVGTPTEMTTVYYLDDGILNAAHYCQLGNQPHLTAVSTETEGDLHFLCNGQVSNTQSHDELHMHGVHFQKKETSLLIWMDMLKNGKVVFETRYELFRVD